MTACPNYLYLLTAWAVHFETAIFVASNIHLPGQQKTCITSRIRRHHLIPSHLPELKARTMTSEANMYSKLLVYKDPPCKPYIFVCHPSTPVYPL